MPGKQEQQSALQVDGLIDPETGLVVDVPVFASDPATYPVRLQIRIETTGEHVVCAGITDEEGVILNRVHHGRQPEVNPYLRKPCATQKVERAAIPGE